MFRHKKKVEKLRTWRTNQICYGRFDRDKNDELKKDDFDPTLLPEKEK